MALTKAFVLNSIDYKDSGKIIYLYTNNGHLSTQVYGVKKLNSTFRYLAQNGTLLNVSVTNAKLPTLKEAELINDYERIKKDLIKYTYMNHIMELVRNTISDDLNHPKMMQFLEKLFFKMNQNSDEEILTSIFELKLLYFLGYGLQFKGCSLCDDDEDLVFHPSNGGLVCRKHLLFQDTYYEKEIYQILIQLYYIDLDKDQLPNITPNQKRIIRQIIDGLYDEFVGFKTKSSKIIKQLQKY